MSETPVSKGIELERTNTSQAPLEHLQFLRHPLIIAGLLLVGLYTVVFLWAFFSSPPALVNGSVVVELAPAPIDTEQLLRSDVATEEKSAEVLEALRSLPDDAQNPEVETAFPKPEAAPEQDKDEGTDAAQASDPTTQGEESAFVLPLRPLDRDGEEAAGPANPETSSPGSLAAAPFTGMTERGRYGLLPIIDREGRKPWKAYASPKGLQPLSGPMVAVVIGGMGISESSTNFAVRELPAEVSFAFAPYGSGLQRLVNDARAQGHEVVLELPMEPFDYPNNDPGPYTLLTGPDAEKNLDRLEWLLSRTNGYVGVTNYQGARFLTDQSTLAPIMAELEKRGLAYIDHPSARRSKAGEEALRQDIPFARGTVILDPVLTKHAIDEALLTLEETARREGRAIGFASGFPLTIERIRNWSLKLAERGVTLVPISATVAPR